MAALKRRFSSSFQSTAPSQPQPKRPRVVTQPHPVAATPGSLNTFQRIGRFMSQTFGLGLKGRAQRPVVTSRRSSTGLDGLEANPQGSLALFENENVAPKPAWDSIIEITDSDGDDDHRSDSREDADTRARHLAEKRQARDLLNDHITERDVHPNLERPLFSSSFGVGAHSPSSSHWNVDGPRPASASTSLGEPSTPTTTKSMARPDVTYSRPERTYDWARRRSPGSSSRSSEESASRSPRRFARSRSSSNLRSEPQEHAQRAIELRIQQAERSGELQAARALRRVQDDLLRGKDNRGKVTIPNVRNESKDGDIVASLGALKLAPRLQLDEAIAPPAKKFIPPVIKKQRIPDTRFELRKSEFLRLLKEKDQEEENRLKARLQPSIPHDVTHDQAAIVKARLRDPTFKTELNGMVIDSQTLSRLKPAVWLNDDIVNYYIELIKARAATSGSNVSSMNSYFFAKLDDQGYEGAKLKRWTKRMKLDIFALDKLLIPINVRNNHWVCAVINFAKRRIEYYDSLSDSGFRFKVFEKLRSYLKAEHKEKKGTSLDLDGWEDVYNPKTPRQDNGSDCGVFACQTLETAARGRDLVAEGFEFSAANMPFFRRLMVVEIASGELANRSWRSG